jgi:Ca2+:H+ antiporter
MGRHRNYFVQAKEDDGGGHAEQAASRPVAVHATFLIAYMLPVVFLTDELAKPIDYVTETLGAPLALGGVVLAVLVATPEAIGAVRAAFADHLQRSVNIFLGSVLSTIGLTVPIMLAFGALSGQHIVLGSEHAETVLLLLTLAVSVVTFASGHTNLLQGAVHLVLFGAYVFLIFQG